MKISETLCLDHFIAVISEDCLEELSEITSKLSGVVYRKTNVINDSWEGLYIKTNSGEYIEFMSPGRRKGVHFAFSSQSPIYTDVRKLRRQFADVKWEAGTRFWPDKSKWFTWLRLKNNDKKGIAEYLSTWAMFYYPRYYHSDFVDASAVCTPRSFARISELVVVIGPEKKQMILSQFKWLEYEQSEKVNSFTLILRNREFEKFYVKFEIKKGIRNVIFKSVTLETHRMKKIKIKKSKLFTITQAKGRVIIKVNNVQDGL